MGDKSINNADEAVLMDLPWYVNGTLDPDAIQRVEAHLATSEALRAALAEEQRLCAAIQELADFETTAVSGFDALRARIAAVDARPKRKVNGWILPRFPSLSLPRLRWIAGMTASACGVALAALVALSPPQDDAPYRTVTTPMEIEGPYLRIVLAETAPMVAIRALLADHDLAIIDGPGETGVLTLRPRADADLGRLMSVLSEAPGIEYVLVKAGK